MRTGFFVFLVALAGCEPCLDYSTPTCLPPAGQEVANPGPAPADPPEQGFFFWELEKSELPQGIEQIGLRAICVDADGGGVPGTPPAFFGEEFAPPPESVELQVELHPAFRRCYLHLLFNEAELPPEGGTPPGVLSYNIDNGQVVEALLIDDPVSPFYGSWVIDL